ncbi:unnamed protein product [Schistosoma curassoni]|uniref:Transposase n=1 Tax=Schistosoma curassoni TaxID=6186 RepID=A0A183JS87_9TREM|nr:unnamed protein product [Schistosoma curassoni]
MIVTNNWNQFKKINQGVVLVAKRNNQRKRS